jgi:hypothetical protein
MNWPICVEATMTTDHKLQQQQDLEVCALEEKREKGEDMRVGRV